MAAQVLHYFISINIESLINAEAEASWFMESNNSHKTVIILSGQKPRICFFGIEIRTRGPSKTERFF